jgi:hypothetical protein
MMTELVRYYKVRNALGTRQPMGIVGAGAASWAVLSKAGLAV